MSKSIQVTSEISVRVPRAGLVSIRVDEDEESLTYRETRRLIVALTRALPAAERPSVDLLPHLREAFSYIASDMAGNRLSDFPLYRQLRDAVKRGERAAGLDESNPWLDIASHQSRTRNAGSSWLDKPAEGK